MYTLILQTPVPVMIDPIIAGVESTKMKCTLHFNDERVELVIPVDREFDDTERRAMLRSLSAVCQTYFDPAPTVHPMEDVKVREFEGQSMTVELLTSVDPVKKSEIDDKGPEVPTGINLMGSRGAEEIGDVRPCDPVGFVQDYLDGKARGLEALAGMIGQVVVRHNDGYWIRLQEGWRQTTQGAAISKVKSEWRPVLASHGVKCSQKHIEDVFKRFLLPVVDGTLTSPVESDFVEYQGGTYLNLRLASRLEPTTFGADGRLIREFILSNVLDEHRSWTAIEDELTDPNAKSPTKWALNWIAHLYQRPGVALPTALWLISVEQGIGKSLFASMLATLVGRSNVAKAEQSEMTGDWSNWLVGKSFVIADEINVTEKKTFYAKQKSWIGSDSISVRARGIGTWMIPTIANWIFLSNDLTPIRIDAADRRNMLITSSNDLESATAMIERIKPIISDPKRFRSALAEFGSWLDSIVIDLALISRAIATELKDDLIENTRDPVDTFVLDQAESAAWKTGEWLTTERLMQRYTAWCELTDVFKGFRSQSHLVKELKRLKARGWVESERKHQGRGWTLTKPPIVVLTPNENATQTQTVASFFAAKTGSMLQRMIDREHADRRRLVGEISEAA